MREDEGATELEGADPAPQPSLTIGATQNSQSAETRFVFLGDFVDRG